jgi:hypothetical protein
VSRLFFPCQLTHFRETEKEEAIQKAKERIASLEASLAEKEGAIRGERRKAEAVELELCRQLKFIDSLQVESVQKNGLVARFQREALILKASLRDILELCQDGDISSVEHSFDFGHCDLTSIGLQGAEDTDDQSLISAVDFGESVDCSHESPSVIQQVKQEVFCIKQKLIENQQNSDSHLHLARADNSRLKQELHRLKLSSDEIARSLRDQVDELTSELHTAQQKGLASQTEIRELVDSLIASEQQVEALTNDLQRSKARETELIDELATFHQDLKATEAAAPEV